MISTQYYQTILYDPANYLQVAIAATAERAQLVTSLENAEVSPILIAFDNCEFELAFKIGFQHIRIYSEYDVSFPLITSDVQYAHRITTYNMSNIYEMLSLVNGISAYYLLETMFTHTGKYTSAAADITPEFANDFITYLDYYKSTNSGEDPVLSLFKSISTSFDGCEKITKYSHVGCGISIGRGCEDRVGNVDSEA